MSAAEAFRVIVIEADDEEGPAHETPPETEGATTHPGTGDAATQGG